MPQQTESKRIWDMILTEAQLLQDGNKVVSREDAVRDACIEHQALWEEYCAAVRREREEAASPAARVAKLQAQCRAWVQKLAPPVTQAAPPAPAPRPRPVSEHPVVKQFNARVEAVGVEEVYRTEPALYRAYVAAYRTPPTPGAANPVQKSALAYLAHEEKAVRQAHPRWSDVEVREEVLTREPALRKVYDQARGV